MSSTIDGPRAEERVARTITLVTAIGALLLGLISLGSMFSAAPYLQPWYTPFAVTAVFGGFLVLVLVVFFLRLPNIRIAHGAYALLFLGVQVALVPALGGQPLPEGLPPWVLEMPAIGTACAAIAWRASIAWGYLILTSLLEAPLRWIAHGPGHWDLGLQYALLTVILAGLFTALAIVAMRNAAVVDIATIALRETAARSAAATARAQEQARLDALVHDEVMNTLFYASRGDAALVEPLRRQARSALAELELLRHGRTTTRDGVSVSEFVSRLRSVVLESSIEITFTVTGERAADIPGDVAAAFAEATSEAARNSLTHAPAATRSVSVRLATSRIDVRVVDNGPGFDANDVAPHRLGIPVSIRGRLAAIPRGYARVQSSKGRGTVVVLIWSDT